MYFKAPPVRETNWETLSSQSLVFYKEQEHFILKTKKCQELFYPKSKKKLLFKNIPRFYHKSGGSYKDRNGVSAFLFNIFEHSPRRGERTIWETL